MLTTRRHFLALAAAAPAFASVGYMANAASQAKIYSEDGMLRNMVVIALMRSPRGR